MSAVPDLLVRPDAADQFVVSFGKSGALGVFNAPMPFVLRRGDQVVVHTERGIEVGSVLCPATIRQARLLGAGAAGALLRPLGADDAARLPELRRLSQRLFDAARDGAEAHRLAVEILDVELLLDGRHAIVQFVGNEAGLDALAHGLEQAFPVEIRLENLAPPRSRADDEPRCDKPDCGRNAGGCTTCSTGGGCSSCGSARVDMRDYFAHLRDKMEKNQRRSLA
jgi:hypothetical protein